MDFAWDLSFGKLSNVLQNTLKNLKEQMSDKRRLLNCLFQPLLFVENLERIVIIVFFKDSIIHTFLIHAGTSLWYMTIDCWCGNNLNKSWMIYFLCFFQYTCIWLQLQWKMVKKQSQLFWSKKIIWVNHIQTRRCTKRDILSSLEWYWIWRK